MSSIIARLKHLEFDIEAGRTSRSEENSATARDAISAITDLQAEVARLTAQCEAVRRETFAECETLVRNRADLWKAESNQLPSRLAAYNEANRIASLIRAAAIRAIKEPSR